MLEEQNAPQPAKPQYNGVFILIAINLILFVLDEILQIGLMRNLYLNHARPQWYQFVTSMFCHANWAHISGNLFFLYIFGKLVEEEEGLTGILGSYLICGLGANLVSWWLQPNIVSLGASGAVFGLFTVSILLKLSWNWRNLLEILILGQFVLQRVLFEIQNLGEGGQINRVAHLSGALVGVVLVLLLMRFSSSSKRN
ncbi:rhomboid family intramembrane serine protease [Geitlerinema sp. PCC 9228]|jgi:membrane associated rhomboid family serine protease|uniref:rhomboid family intramembrane serine protease n=1 Tax=Geitlerinema sp. PCC 9228 TaxID=111611 RepID=UPI0008F9B048|nr:rhomboid family intramembrane serine protease [Geitlerinema sp. PCC 9228]